MLSYTKPNVWCKIYRFQIYSPKHHALNWCISIKQDNNRKKRNALMVLKKAASSSNQLTNTIQDQIIGTQGDLMYC